MANFSQTPTCELLAASQQQKLGRRRAPFAVSKRGLQADSDQEFSSGPPVVLYGEEPGRVPRATTRQEVLFGPQRPARWSASVGLYWGSWQSLLYRTIPSSRVVERTGPRSGWDHSAFVGSSRRGKRPLESRWQSPCRWDLPCGVEKTFICFRQCILEDVPRPWRYSSGSGH